MHETIFVMIFICSSFNMAIGRVLCRSCGRTTTSPLYSSQASVSDYPNFSFKVIHQDKDTKARAGILETPHGIVETPNFVFCATKAAMKTITPSHLREEGSQICLSNTYHLMLTPGPDVIEKMGGLQKFTSWHGPMCRSYQFILSTAFENDPFDCTSDRFRRLPNIQHGLRIGVKRN